MYSSAPTICARELAFGLPELVDQHRQRVADDRAGDQRDVRRPPRLGCVIESHFGKYPARESEYVFRPYA